MRWSEFCDLLSGLSPDTALMRVVSIRSEEDQDILKHFTPAQRTIRAQWRNKTAKRKNPQDTAAFLADMQHIFAKMAGGGDK